MPCARFRYLVTRFHQSRGRKSRTAVIKIVADDFTSVKAWRPGAASTPVPRRKKVGHRGRRGELAVLRRDRLVEPRWRGGAKYYPAHLD